MQKCDWLSCLEEGEFNGVRAELLNTEGKKNTAKEFVFLCQEHFRVGVNERET